MIYNVRICIMAQIIYMVHAEFCSKLYLWNFMKEKEKEHKIEMKKIGFSKVCIKKKFEIVVLNEIFNSFYLIISYLFSANNQIGSWTK